MTTCKQSTCANTCLTECVNNACKFGCGSTCTGTCENSCYSECKSSGCKNKCTGSCLGSCSGDSCATSCSVGCANTCYDACGTSCVNNCSESCVDACRFGCETGCKGMTSKVATYRDRVFDPNAAEEPSRNLGEKFERGEEGGIEGKAGYDPANPDAPYDASFATTPGALNDKPFIKDNSERTYNGTFDPDGTMVKAPKAFDYGKAAIVESGEYIKVPEDAKFNGGIDYYTRSGDGSAENPYRFDKIEIGESEFNSIVVLKNTSDPDRTYNLWMKNREFIEREKNGTEVDTKVAKPTDSNRKRDPDNYHDADGTLKVSMDGKILIKVIENEVFRENVTYCIRETANSGPFTIVKNYTLNSAGTWGDFVTYRNAGRLYKVGAALPNTSPDNADTSYDGTSGGRNNSSV